jgi:thiamine-phosphate pyrophosphorylase
MRTDIARIVDAEVNRAREGMRIVEDYCRFVLDDRCLMTEVKDVRHRLRLLAERPATWGSLAARDTLGDVGTALTTAAESSRQDLFAVVAASFKRVEEALRALEECGKLLDPRWSLDAKALRYGVYTLEKAVVNIRDSQQRLASVRLCAIITQAACAGRYEWTIEEAIRGGAGMIQLREKDMDDSSRLKQARLARKVTRQSGTLLIVNDRADIAQLADADGVHVGQDDLAVRDARRILGPTSLVGVSTHDLGQVRRAVLDGANYIGIGPMFPSPTKDFSHYPGLDFIREAMQETTLPAFAIGGIDEPNLERVIGAGGRRIAVSRALCAAQAPADVAARLTAALPALPDLEARFTVR